MIIDACLVDARRKSCASSATVVQYGPEATLTRHAPSQLRLYDPSRFTCLEVDKQGVTLVFRRAVVYPARMPVRIQIAPSILSADMGHLAREIECVESAGADWIHIDVVDGHFAPYLSFGPGTVQAARAATRLPLDVHLMVNHPERYFDSFAEAGADHLTVHPEVCDNLKAALQRIHSLGMRAGVALAPDSPTDSIVEVLSLVDVVLVLCVHPGKSGQKFMENQLVKLQQLRELIDRSDRSIDLVVDGGVSADNAAAVVKAGARILVSGSQIFGSPDRAKAITAIRSAADA